MARYRSTDMDLAYGDPPAQRWDSSRFARESETRRAPVIEQRPPYQSARREERPYYEDQRHFEADHRSGPRGARDRQFYDEDEYYDPRANQGAMVPFRPERPPRPAAPPRPRMVRRQSSVDRIDFERRRYYDRDNYRPPPPAPPRESQGSRYDIRIYDDVKVQDPDYYGDDGFREYRETEWTRSRTRADDPSPDRRAPTRASTHISTRDDIIQSVPPVSYETEKIIQETKIVEKPYPRRGKTRMPKRLVHTKVLFDLGYPFYEEDEKTILIEKALGPDNIDEVFARSKEYREKEVVTTRLIEAPPATATRSVREWSQSIDRSPSPGSSISQAPSRKSRRRARSVASRGNRRQNSVHESIDEDIHRSGHYSRHGDSVHESFHEDIHRSRSRSVSPVPTARSRKPRARSRATTRRGSGDSETLIERRTTIVDASPGRARTRRGASVHDTEIIERKIIERENIDESSPVDLNFPLAIATRSRQSRTDADIEDEIRRLELERRGLRRDTEVIRYDRQLRRDISPVGRLREPSPRGEIIIADTSDNRRDSEVVAVRKDKRGRMSLIV